MARTFDRHRSRHVFEQALLPPDGVLIHLFDPDKLWRIRCNRKHKFPLRTALNMGVVTCRMCRAGGS